MTAVFRLFFGAVFAVLLGWVFLSLLADVAHDGVVQFEACRARGKSVAWCLTEPEPRDAGAKQ